MTASPFDIKAVPDSTEREKLEAALRKRIQVMLKTKWDEAIEQIEQGKVINLAEFEKDLNVLLQVELTKIAETELQSQSESVGVGFDPTAFNEAAREWAKQYTYDLVRGITERTHELIADAITTYTQGGVTHGQLQEMLSPAFGEDRASKIAISEVTRAYGQASSIYRDMLHDEGVDMERVWQTDADSLVCHEICKPLNGVAENENHKFVNPKNGKEYDFPAHVGCRCGPRLRIRRGQ